MDVAILTVGDEVLAATVRYEPRRRNAGPAIPERGNVSNFGA